MRRGQLLVTQIQRATENERIGANDGISLEEYYQYLTDGARFIQAKILSRYARLFRKSLIWSADGLESRTLPGDTLNSEAIVSLEYSSSGAVRDYRPMQRALQLGRFSDTGVPYQYIVQDRAILLGAYPSSGSFRLTYAYLLPAVDKRRATVASKTASTTALTLLTIAGPVAADYALYDHMCIVDFHGVVKMRGIPYSAVDAVSGVVTVLGGTYTFPTDGTAIAVGDYVCLGENASTHALLDPQCESALLLYATKRILIRDSSDDAIANDVQMQILLEAILDTYESMDVEPIPLVANDHWDCE